MLLKPCEYLHSKKQTLLTYLFYFDSSHERNEILQWVLKHKDGDLSVSKIRIYLYNRNKIEGSSQKKSTGSKTCRIDRHYIMYLHRSHKNLFRSIHFQRAKVKGRTSNDGVWDPYKM